MKRENRSQIIYIAGCSHSGTTLLDLLLSTHPGVCGLGEARMLVEDARRPEYTSNADERICSCGHAINQCPLWSRFLDRVKETPDADFGDRYATLIDLFRSVVGPDVVVSDSSKYIGPLRRLIAALRDGDLVDIDLDDLLVVHLVKDARAYATSMKYRHDLAPWSLAKRFYKWYAANQKISAFLDDENIASVQITYEQLCFHPDAVLGQIFDASGLVPSEQTGELRAAKAHVGLGNPMRTHDQKSQGIVYDSRWFHEPIVQGLYYLLPGVRSYNEAIGASGLHNR